MRERHDIDWRPIVGRVAWVPPEHRDANIDEATAVRMLRCTSESFQRLRDTGLPADDGVDGPLFDICDLRNAALYSGSGVTDMELAMAGVFDYMRAAPDELVGARTWAYTLTTRRPLAAAGDRVARPTPEDSGGSLVTCRDPSGADVCIDGDHLVLTSDARLVGTMVTQGARLSVRSGDIRKIARDFLDSGIIWHSLPPALDMEPSAAAALGVGGCVTLSVLLQGLLDAAGYPARAYWGWLAGAVNTPHTWVRVIDDDGAAKWLDPALALLARAGRLGTEAFVDMATGSCLNRVVPSRLPVVDDTKGELAERDLDLSSRAVARVRTSPDHTPRPVAAQ